MEMLALFTLFRLFFWRFIGTTVFLVDNAHLAKMAMNVTILRQQHLLFWSKLRDQN